MINIIFEDNDLIVVNKPKHLLTHPTSFKEKDTLVNLLREKINVKEFDDQTRPGIVHRLDKDTTGLIVIAKNKKTHDSLFKQIQEKTLQRKYLCLVHHPFHDQFLLINAPIARSKKNELKMIVTDEPKAKPSQTRVTVLKNYKDAALVECQLLTGRTHQIRVHMSYIHHPVFNDPVYGSSDGYKEYGQFLHAHFLLFTHPSNNKLMKFEIEPDKTFVNLQNKLSEN